MKYTFKGESGGEEARVQKSLEPIVSGLGLTLIEFSAFKKRGAVQIKAVVYKNGTVGVDDCTKVYRAILPRLEMAFSGTELNIEVSSPGIERLIKDGNEFGCFTGRGLRCYRTDISDWTGGILLSSDEHGVCLKTKDGEISLPYAVIGKAKLSHLEEQEEKKRGS
ncbi:MAG: ribosome assembly cofactor RimP [Treponema sp.]|jgi:ribosome maturation factor RimP|nr:ribosome assembly cofactor RimP [Treponema sp.]